LLSGRSGNGGGESSSSSGGGFELVKEIFTLGRENEHWKFSAGQLVRCRQQKLSGGDSLVAYEGATI